MVSYAAGAYYAMMEGVRAMLQYEGYIKEELTKTFLILSQNLFWDITTFMLNIPIV